MNNKINNKQPNVYVPTREEFNEFCINGMKLDDQEWIDAIWKLASKVGWRKKNGEAPNHWHSLVSAYNGVLIAQREENLIYWRRRKTLFLSVKRQSSTRLKMSSLIMACTMWLIQMGLVITYHKPRLVVRLIFSLKMVRL